MDDDSQVQSDAPAPAPVPDVVAEPPASSDTDIPAVTDTDVPADDASTTEPTVSTEISPPSDVVPPTPVTVSAPSPAFDPHSADEISFLKLVLGPRAWAARRARTAEGLDKVMELARSKGTIDRTQVRLHLEVSQATATRYLTALVKQGKLARRHVLDDNLYTVL